MKKINVYVFTVISIGLIAFSGCKKKEGCIDKLATNYDSKAKVNDGSCIYDNAVTDVGNTSTGSASASMTSTQEDATIYNMVSNSAENGEVSNKALGDTIKAVPSCATLSIQSNGVSTWPKTLTIDFGTSGCVGYDGRSRKGKIMARFSGNWKLHNVNDSITVTFENYSVNDTVITGTRYFWINTASVITNGTMKLGYKSVNAALIYGNGTQSTWECSGTIDISGLNTLNDYTDDIIDTDITGNGTTVDGSSYSLTTSTPLLTELSCIQTCAYTKGVAVISTTKETVVENVVNGVTITSTFNSDIDITLDFGDGTCDGIYLATTGIVSKNENDVIIYEETGAAVTYNCGELGTMTE